MTNSATVQLRCFGFSLRTVRHFFLQAAGERERSSAATTAIVYDCRVGTSICEVLKRKSSMAIASGRLGISGTSISTTDKKP